MALYDHFAALFMTQELSDFQLRCTDSTATIPVHRVVLSAQSPVFHRDMAAAPTMNGVGRMILSDKDPSVLIKFLSIMYRGSYDDVVFGQWTAPHIATTWSLDKLWSFISKGHGTEWEADKKDQKALYNFVQSHDVMSTETWNKVFESFKDAFYLYMMAKKYQCAIAGVVAHERFHDILDLFLDKEEYGDVEIGMLVEFIDELYEKTVPGGNLRKEMCIAIKRFSKEEVEVGRRIKAQAAELIRVRPEFLDDMNNCII